MRLASFIRAESKNIVAEWEGFAHTLIPQADGLSALALRDHISQILDFVAGDMDSPQTGDEQAQKSRGEKPAHASDYAAEAHASLRHAGGFGFSQMVSEFRALRASVIRLWSKTDPGPTDAAVVDMVRFNEAVDQALTTSVKYYSDSLDGSRALLLGILSHDLRGPLSAAQMASQLALKLGPLTERQTMLISQSIESTERASSIVVSLLDLTGARLGSGLPIIREPLNMAFVSRTVVDEMQTLHPRRRFNLEISGDMHGEWDKPRLGQVFSNLLDNAVKYSFKGSPISICVKGSLEDITVSVHDFGPPIAGDAVERIFKPFSGASTKADQLEYKGLGLGLFIVKEIVTAHGGTVGASSSERDGTTFTLRLPRSAAQLGQRSDEWASEPINFSKHRRA